MREQRDVEPRNTTYCRFKVIQPEWEIMEEIEEINYERLCVYKRERNSAERNLTLSVSCAKLAQDARLIAKNIFIAK